MAERNGHDPGPVRPLDPADLPDCLDLAAGRGRPQARGKVAARL
jgi:hypothetical protein